MKFSEIDTGGIMKWAFLILIVFPLLSNLLFGGGSRPDRGYSGGGEDDGHDDDDTDVYDPFEPSYWDSQNDFFDSSDSWSSDDD